MPLKEILPISVNNELRNDAQLDTGRKQNELSYLENALMH